MLVSKKYQYTNVRGGPYETIYECVAELETGEYILVYPMSIGSQVLASTVVPKITAEKHYVEYVEPPKPVVHTRYVHWCKSKFGQLYTSTEDKCNPRKIDLLHIETITLTEYPDSKWISSPGGVCK